MTDELSVTDVSCPNCGNDSVCTLAGMRDMHVPDRIEHMDGGYVDQLTTFARFYCNECDRDFGFETNQKIIADHSGDE